MDSLYLIMSIKNTNNIKQTIETILKQTISNWHLLIICNNSEYLYTYNYLKTTYKNNDKISFQLQTNSNYGVLLNKYLNLFFKTTFSHLVLINSNDQYYPNFLKFLLEKKKEFVHGSYHAKYNILETKFKNKKDLLEK